MNDLALTEAEIEILKSEHKDNGSWTNAQDQEFIQACNSKTREEIDAEIARIQSEKEDQ